MPLRPLAVAAVLIESPDPPRLAAFYRDLLGVPLGRVELPGVEPHFAGEVGQVYLAITFGKKTESGTCVAFMVDDVEKAARALEGAKVALDGRPKRTALGLIARFRDPDGNPFELYQP